MPHLILEYPATQLSHSQLKLLLSQLHQAVCSTQLFIESHIKLRAYPCEHYLVAGEESPFFHLQARIKPGRSDADKKRLSEALLTVLRSPPQAAGVITVEVVDMDANSYAKAIL